MPNDQTVAVAKPNAAITLRADVEARVDDYRPLLPPHVPPERFIRVLLTAIAKNPDLIAADRRSFLNACLEAAKDGLPPDGKVSALVIRKTKDGKSTVNYERMVGGWRELAARAGCQSLYGRVVFSRDQFDFAEGVHRSLQHKPAIGDRGAPIGAYAVAKFGDDREPDWLFLDWATIQKRRAISRAQSPAAPWATWTLEMAEKTVVKALCNDLMLAGPEAERLRSADDSEDREPRDVTPPPRPERADYLAPPAEPEPAVEHDPDTGEIVDEAAAAHMAAIASATPAAKPARNWAVPANATIDGWLDHRNKLMDALANNPERWSAIEAANRAGIAASPHRADIAAAIQAAQQAAAMAGG